MTDQFANIERNVAVIFDGAAALRFLLKPVLRQWLACVHALPPCLRRGGGTVGSFVSRHGIDPMCPKEGNSARALSPDCSTKSNSSSTTLRSAVVARNFHGPQGPEKETE
jgi:hypothetical protein